MTGARSARRPMRLLAALLTVAAGSVAAGCGIPTQDAARVIPKNQVPPGLTTATSQSTTTSSPQRGTNIFLVAGPTLTPQSKLVVVVRNLTTPVSLTAAIKSLLEGPATTERVRGIITAIGRGVQLVRTKVTQTGHTKTRETVTVNLSATFALSYTGLSQKLAVAQVVYTVDAFVDTNPPPTVLFQITGVLIGVPVTSGAVTNEGVNVSNYQTVAPPKTTKTP